MHSRPSDQRRRTPDGRACCDNVVVVSCDCDGMSLDEKVNDDEVEAVKPRSWRNIYRRRRNFITIGKSAVK